MVDNMSLFEETREEQALLCALLDLRQWLAVWLEGSELENLVEATKKTIKDIEVLLPEEKIGEIARGTGVYLEETE